MRRQGVLGRDRGSDAVCRGPEGDEEGVSFVFTSTPSEVSTAARISRLWRAKISG